MNDIRLRRLVLVRHGETEGQSSIRYYGATDVPLNAVGRSQMERVRAALAGECFDAVYTSALRRTTLAAEIIVPGVPRRELAGFNEINFGQWEGLAREEIAARDPELFRRWRCSLDDFIYPGGDAVAAFRARVVATLRMLLPEMPERVLMVVHRGVIASVATELLGLSPSERAAWAIDLGSIHTLVAAGGTWHAHCVNEMRHLDGAR